MRAMVFANKAMATRTALAQQAQNWLNEAGTLPPGNGVERDLWEVNNVFFTFPSCLLDHYSLPNAACQSLIFGVGV